MTIEVTCDRCNFRGVVLAQLHTGVCPLCEKGHLIMGRKLPDTERDEFKEAMRKFGATPLPEDRRRAVGPSDVIRDAWRVHIGEGADRRTPAEFYAAWATYDASLPGMSRPAQDLQRKSEILALECLWADSQGNLR